MFLEIFLETNRRQPQANPLEGCPPCKPFLNRPDSALAVIPVSETLLAGRSEASLGPRRPSFPGQPRRKEDPDPAFFAEGPAVSPCSSFRFPRNPLLKEPGRSPRQRNSRPGLKGTERSPARSTGRYGSAGLLRRRRARSRRGQAACARARKA